MLFSSCTLQKCPWWVASHFELKLLETVLTNYCANWSLWKCTYWLRWKHDTNPISKVTWGKQWELKRCWKCLSSEFNRGKKSFFLFQIPRLLSMLIIRNWLNASSSLWNFPFSFIVFVAALAGPPLCFQISCTELLTTKGFFRIYLAASFLPFSVKFVNSGARVLLVFMFTYCKDLTAHLNGCPSRIYSPSFC